MLTIVSFICFLEELRTPWNAFEIYLPLERLGISFDMLFKPAWAYCGSYVYCTSLELCACSNNLERHGAIPERGYKRDFTLFFSVYNPITYLPFFKCQKIQDNSNLFVRWKFNQKKFVKLRHFHVILFIHIFVLLKWILLHYLFYFWNSKRIMTNFLRTISYHYSFFKTLKAK